MFVCFLLRGLVLEDFSLKKKSFWNLPGGPVVRTPHFHCMDSMPGLGTNIPQATKKKKKNKLLKGTNLILKGKVMMEEELEKKIKRSPNKKGKKYSF